MKILIDMDGPLVDGRARQYEAHRRVLETLGLPKLGSDDFWRRVRRAAPIEEFVLGGQSKHVQAYQKAMIEQVEADDLLDRDALRPNADGAVRALKSLGEPILITMRLNRPGAQAVLNRLHLSDFFLRIAGLSQSSDRRCEQLHELAGESVRVVVATSSEVIVRAARNADVPVVGIDGGPRTPQQLRRAGADVVFADLDEMAVALASNSPAMQRAGVLPAAR